LQNGFIDLGNKSFIKSVDSFCGLFRHLVRKWIAKVVGEQFSEYDVGVEKPWLGLFELTSVSSTFEM